MTGYTVHTGSTKKFSSGWDRIFSGDTSGESGAPTTSAKKKAASKKSAPKKAASAGKAKAQAAKSSKSKKKAVKKGR
jgi:hypothetical protein